MAPMSSGVRAGSNARAMVASSIICRHKASSPMQNLLSAARLSASTLDGMSRGLVHFLANLLVLYP